jgi:predicted RNase H-like HicB family nuclease
LEAGSYARQSSSVKHPIKPGRVTVPGNPNDDLAPGTLNSILKQAGLKRGLSVRYGIVIERANANYSAYVPDLPGCVVTGLTIEEVQREMRGANRFHIEGLRQDGLPIPEPSVIEYIDA